MKQHISLFFHIFQHLFFKAFYLPQSHSIFISKHLFLLTILLHLSFAINLHQLLGLSMKILAMLLHLLLILFLNLHFVLAVLLIFLLLVIQLSKIWFIHIKIMRIFYTLVTPFINLPYQNELALSLQLLLKLLHLFLNQKAFLIKN